MIFISETKPDRSLLIKVEGKQYTIPRPGDLQRSVLRAMKIAAGSVHRGQATPADHELLSQLNTPQIEGVLLGQAKQEMERDGLAPRLVHDISVVAFHFHTDGIRGAQWVTDQLNRKAAA